MQHTNTCHRVCHDVTVCCKTPHALLSYVISLSNHRVDSVIESSLREIIGSKNLALINLNLNFCETTIYDNKVFLENIVAVH